MRREGEYREQNKSKIFFQEGTFEVHEGSLVLLCGTDESQKTLFARQNFPASSIVSLGEIRRLVTNNPKNTLQNQVVESIFQDTVRKRLMAGKTTVVVAPNLKHQDRQRLLEISAEINKTRKRFRGSKQVQNLAFLFDAPKHEKSNHETESLLSQTKNHLAHSNEFEALFQINPETEKKVNLELEEGDELELLGQNQLADLSVEIETDLLNYASTLASREIPGDAERVRIQAGTTAFFEKSPESEGFLRDNTLSFQVLDLDYYLKKLGKSEHDWSTLEHIIKILRAREAQNLTTFVTGGQSSQEVVVELKKSLSYHEDVNLPPEKLKQAFLEIDYGTSSNEPLFVIGDVHGCLEALKSLRSGLRSKEGMHGEQRKILFLGDLADRGPKDAETVIYASALISRGEAYLVKGNHDLALEKRLSALLAKFASDAAVSPEHAETLLNLIEGKTKFDSQTNSEALKSLEQSWTTFISNLSDQEILQVTPGKSQSLPTFQKLVRKEGEKIPRLHFASFLRIFKILKEAPFFREFKHLCAAHAAFPKSLRNKARLTISEQEDFLYGIKKRGKVDSNTGWPATEEVEAVTTGDPGRVVVTGHSHIFEQNKASGTIVLDNDAVLKGELVGMMFPEREFLIGKETKVLEVWQRTKNPEFPTGEELGVILKHLESVGLLSSKSLAHDSELNSLRIYKLTEETSSFLREHPLLRKFEGLLVSKEGLVLSVPPEKMLNLELDFPDSVHNAEVTRAFLSENRELYNLFNFKGKWYGINTRTLELLDHDKVSQALSSRLQTSLDPTKSYQVSLAGTDSAFAERIRFYDVRNSADGKALSDPSLKDEIARIQTVSGEVVGSKEDLVFNIGISSGSSTLKTLLEKINSVESFQNLGKFTVQFEDQGRKESVELVGSWFSSREYFLNEMNWEALGDFLKVKKLSPNIHDEIILLGKHFDNDFIRAVFRKRAQFFTKQVQSRSNEVFQKAKEVLSTANVLKPVKRGAKPRFQKEEIEDIYRETFSPEDTDIQDLVVSFVLKAMGSSAGYAESAIKNRIIGNLQKTLTEQTKNQTPFTFKELP